MRVSLCNSKNREMSRLFTICVKHFEFEMIMLLKYMSKGRGGKNKRTDSNEVEM